MVITDTSASGSATASVLTPHGEVVATVSIAYPRNAPKDTLSAALRKATHQLEMLTREGH